MEKFTRMSIKASWLKQRNASGVLCDGKILLKLKGKFYKTAIRPILLYGSKCWAIKYQHERKTSVAKMRMLRWMCDHTRKDKIRNEVIRNKIEVVLIEKNMRKIKLRQFGYVRRKPIDALVRRVDEIE